jgi:hypothetical protein
MTYYNTINILLHTMFVLFMNTIFPYQTDYNYHEDIVVFCQASLALLLNLPFMSGQGELLTPALCCRFRALCGRKAPPPPPKRYGRASMPKITERGSGQHQRFVSHKPLLYNKLTSYAYHLLIAVESVYR